MSSSVGEWGPPHGRSHSRMTSVKCTNFNVREMINYFTNGLFAKQDFSFLSTLFPSSLFGPHFSFYDSPPFHCTALDPQQPAPTLTCREEEGMMRAFNLHSLLLGQPLSLSSVSLDFLLGTRVLCFQSISIFFYLCPEG